MLQFMGLQRVGHKLMTEQQQIDNVMENQYLASLYKHFK